MTKIATVAGMRCTRCRMKVTHTLLDLDGVSAATVDLQAGQATIEGTDLTQEWLNAAFEGTKFSVTAVHDSQ